MQSQKMENSVFRDAESCRFQQANSPVKKTLSGATTIQL